MIRRINRTGRTRINRRHIDLSLRARAGREAPIFDLRLQLADYGFPADARVRVDASRGNAGQRWDFGTVGRLTPPPDGERRLTDIDVSTGARFRVCVVAGDGSGKLFGHTPTIKPVLPQGSLLPLEERDLGEEVWRVDFGDGEDLAVLFVNSKVPGISEAVRGDDAFRTLVLPEVFRSILTRMVLIARAAPEDEEGPWADWFGIAKAYLPDAKPPSLRSTPVEDVDAIDRAREWIDEVVGSLAKKPLQAADVYAAALGRGRA